ncbi:hypothetical protein HGRIS_009338 [Hohenbuehelia grisea]|uniref:CASTOR ACT domain-containing protein n=1 Tax=Hohenbuehelia grisea TaxID=104357 RepID=A0ABR3J1C7_9AGAR
MIPYDHQSQVTISLLPVSLALVHVPRSRVTQLSHPILKQILQPSPAFLNITCNEIELSLFAEHTLLADFEVLGRQDRQRQRSRSGSSSSRKSATDTLKDPVEVSYERWSVLQIDSHSDRLENSGARVNELSAPLAAAGISIMYQSSYMSDFIFVKETRLQEVMSLLAQAGFDLYSADQDPWSLVSSHTSSRVSLTDIGTSATPTGAVLTRSRSSTDTSISPILSRVNSTTHSPEASHDSVSSDKRPPVARTKSHSPTAADIKVLPSDLACVGLVDDNIDTWSLKIVKLVAYPDLIQPLPRGASVTPSAAQTTPTFLPYNTSSPASSSASSEDDGYFSHSPVGNDSASSLPTSASLSSPDLRRAENSAPKPVPASKHSAPVLPYAYPLCPHIPSAQDATPAIPFFSFTRTAEGSSLTIGSSHLAALFPPHERYMVICNDELDFAPEDAGLDDEPEDSDPEDADDRAGSQMRCLQVDLRRFGLDKHGLVHRFSKVLEQDGINHMYSSTFKTANLLVDKRQAVRAQRLLRAC